MPTPLCRVCLAGNLKMYSIDNIKLLQIYEKLANAKLKTDDGRPTSLCYICYGQLHRCCRFSEAARRAEDCLTQLLRNGTQVTMETVTALNRGKQATLTVSTPQPISVNDSSGPLLAENERDFEPFNTVYVYECVREIAPIAKEEPTEEILIEVDRIDYESDEPAANDRSDANSERNPEEDEAQDPIAAGASETSELSAPAQPFPCSRCGKEFSLKRYLKSHMLVHSGERRFACAVPECEKTFARKSDLNRHARAHAPAPPRAPDAHRCAVCARVFPNRTGAVSHARAHAATRQHACVSCGRAFRFERNLRAHLRMHAGERPFPCARCPQAFTARGNLAQHMRTHADAPPTPTHACAADACGRTFATRTALRLHATLHAAERRHACPACDKSFHRASYLTRHMRTHSGERPYACRLCEKRYADSGSLHIHMRVHTGERPYACDTCGRAFARSHQLKQHARAAKCAP